MARRPLRDAPAPLAVDLARLMAIGTVAWAVALLVSAVLAASGRIGALAPATCVAGVALGGYGIVWARRHRRR